MGTPVLAVLSNPTIGAVHTSCSIPRTRPRGGTLTAAFATMPGYRVGFHKLVRSGHPFLPDGLSRAGPGQGTVSINLPAASRQALCQFWLWAGIAPDSQLQARPGKPVGVFTVLVRMPIAGQPGKRMVGFLRAGNAAPGEPPSRKRKNPRPGVHSGRGFRGRLTTLLESQTLSHDRRPCKAKKKPHGVGPWGFNEGRNAIRRGTGKRSAFDSKPNRRRPGGQPVRRIGLSSPCHRRRAASSSTAA